MAAANLMAEKSNWRYNGGKNGAGVYQTIINRIPLHDVYIEPFAGSASIYRKKKPAQWSFLIEKDERQFAKLTMLASHNCSVVCGDGILWLSRFLPMPDRRVFVYLDPPYLHSTRKDTRLYRHEFTDAEHEHLVLSLLPALSDLGVLWMVSGYKNALYDDAAAANGWWSNDYTAMTRRGAATETIWTNYDPSRSSIAESTYAGSTFRDRERIKRKAARLVNRFRQLPASERMAMIDALKASGLL